MPKVAFLFKRGRRERLASAEKTPTEFFYGYVQLAMQDMPVDILDEDDLDLAGPIPLPWRLVSSFSHMLVGIHIWAVWQLAHHARCGSFDNFDVLVATTNTYGLSLGVLKRFGLLKARVVFLPMGVGDMAAQPLRRRTIGWLLGSLQTLAISKGEAKHLNRLFGKHADIAYIPFGVDADFWTPDKALDNPLYPYVLSIGNDPRRDYETLLSAWQPEFPQLKIITGLPVRQAGNVEVISGDWRRQLLSDSEIRRLFREALFVVLPIRKTFQPSGQSACLQAMACGKAVIFSDIEGLWDRSLMRDGETCVLVPPADDKQLRTAVERLLANPAMQAKIGRAGRQVVEDHLNVRAMAAELAAHLSGR